MSARTDNTRARDLTRYTPIAHAVAARYRLPGADRDDVHQEALIALWDALGRFDGRGDKRAFLGMCVRRRLASKLRAALREKHRVLNEALTDPEVSGVAYARAGAALVEDDGSRPSGSVSALLAPLTCAEQRACLGVAMGYRNTELGTGEEGAAA